MMNENINDTSDVAGSTAGKEERMWATFAHLSALAGFSLVPVLGFILGPLIIWIIKKEEMPLVADQGREAINSQISFLIYCAIGALIAVPLVFIGIGVFIIPAIIVGNVVLVLTAALKANEGVCYRYPMIFRFFK